MKKAIVFVVFLFMGCTDKNSVKPFECRCDCPGGNFECIGVHTETTKDATKKFIKEAI